MNEISRLGLLGGVSSKFVDVSRLPTNTTTQRHPVHRWFNFIAGFSPEFVEACIGLTVARDDELTLLDPFVGCGTATLTARLLGVNSIGYDPHPFFSRIAEAKANSPRHYSELSSIRRAIEAGFAKPDNDLESLSESAQRFLSQMFEEEHLAQLCGARRCLQDHALDENPLAFLSLSKILDYSCFSSTDGIYKAPTSRKCSVPPLEACSRVFSIIEADKSAALSDKTPSLIIPSSSEDMAAIKDQAVDLIVTSPPYLNNFDFAEMTRMYLYFWGLAHSWSDITQKVRASLIVNTTTALKGHKEKQEVYRSALPTIVQDEANEVIQRLALEKVVRAGKKDYDFLIYPYLFQMQRILEECGRVLRAGGPLHMMVSDAALYGVHVPTPQWLAEVMRHLGFTQVSCEKVRDRGHRWILSKRDGSAQGLGEYYIFGVCGNEDTLSASR